MAVADDKSKLDGIVTVELHWKVGNVIKRKSAG
jgi:hypothetical protein